MDFLGAVALILVNIFESSRSSSSCAYVLAFGVLTYVS